MQDANLDWRRLRAKDCREPDRAGNGQTASAGDVIIDGGNEYYANTERRTSYVESKGLLYIGTGVSGGEEGALKGPSMMPGGSEKAWPLVKPIFQAIAAKVGPNNDIPCCEWVGPRGAGHYVKMVHNGIEYGDMQLICEAYLMLKEAAGLSNDELYDTFDEWNRGELQSYLIEISRDIFSVKDDQGGDGYKAKVAPVGCFPADSNGVHDLIGNVWEWTADAIDPERNVIKGGSYLCAANYCARYRPAARQFQERGLGTDHIGIRLIDPQRSPPRSSSPRT